MDGEVQMTKKTNEMQKKMTQMQEEVEKMHPALWLPQRRLMVRFCSNLVSEQV